MSAAPSPPETQVQATEPLPATAPADGSAPAPGAWLRRRAPWAIGLVLVLAAALGLRLWGIEHGLPYAYNIDENAHYVPRALGLFGHDWNPQYFVNPPAFTYLLRIVFDVWFGGRAGVARAYATDPGSVFLVGRLVVAALGTLTVGLVYAAGARLVDRRVGLLAAALMAVAFLPVFYSHLALNDVPALAPGALALVGVAGVLRHGRLRDYAIAGVGLGLGCATKYTVGIVVFPLLVAAALQVRRDRSAIVGGLLLAGNLAIVCFIAANPYAVIDPEAWFAGLRHQSTASGEAAGKLGLTHDNGVLYYLWTLTWGLGWVPAVAAAGGAVALARANWRLALVLLPAPMLFVVFMGTQERFFGRWLLPIFPLVCILAAYGAAASAAAIGRRAGRLRYAAWGVVAAALLAQGLLYSVHSGRVLSRDDTRNLTRAWMVANVPAGAKIVAEPGVSPDAWAHDPGRPSRATGNGNRWVKFPTSRSAVAANGEPLPGSLIVNVEDYERNLGPGLVATYQSAGYCWVVSGSTQSGRAFAEPDEVPNAIAYYRELRRSSAIAYQVTPYDRGARPVDFSFDWSFDYYPLAYQRPGPVMTVYRLGGGECSPRAASPRARRRAARRRDSSRLSRRRSAARSADRRAARRRARARERSDARRRSARSGGRGADGR
jgi:4-amino-4-deoxy-L-arabinose transferase-like glycosyltransferase